MADVYTLATDFKSRLQNKFRQFRHLLLAVAATLGVILLLLAARFLNGSESQGAQSNRRHLTGALTETNHQPVQGRVDIVHSPP